MCVWSHTIADPMCKTITAVAHAGGVCYSEFHWLWTDRCWNSGCVGQDTGCAMVHWHSNDSQLWCNKFRGFTDLLHNIGHCESGTWLQCLLQAGWGDDSICDSHRQTWKAFLVQGVLALHSGLLLQHVDMVREAHVEVCNIWNHLR